MKRVYLIKMMAVLVLLSSCTIGQAESEGLDQKDITSKQMQHNGEKVGIGDQATTAVLWAETAGEREALYFQGYNIGKMVVDQSLMKNENKKRAIILDIDETVLDNSPYFAYLVNANKAFPYVWDQWVKSASAKPLPGAKEFLNYVDAKNIAIFYVSNRSAFLKDVTIKNLVEQGFPQADSSHVFLQSGNNNKGSRFQHIQKEYRVICFFGDNLGDFGATFNGKTPDLRSMEAKRYKSEFGKKFIVFPNPMYGDWEWALYQYNLNKSPEEKMALRKQALKTFNP